MTSNIEGLTFFQDDASELANLPDGSVDSLSTLHAAEHFGLGRYTDPIDPDGCFKFMSALQRVLAPGGRLYFSVPIGRERVEFNAHRVFAPRTILDAFAGLAVVSFSFVDDAGDLHENADPLRLPRSEMACGLFEFTKALKPALPGIPMQIVTRQISGLGNQLFQYAAGRYYATRYGAGMSMSIDQPQNAVSHGYARPFLLSHFRIQAPVLPMSKLEQLLFSSRPLLKPAALAARQALRIQIVTEAIAQRFTFLEDLPMHPGTRVLYLAGYWQTYRIAAKIEDALRQEFSFREARGGQDA